MPSGHQVVSETVNYLRTMDKTPAHIEFLQWLEKEIARARSDKTRAQ